MRGGSSRRLGAGGAGAASVGALTAGSGRRRGGRGRWRAGAVHRRACALPRAPAAVDRGHVAVAHALQRVDGEHRAVAAAAVHHQLDVRIGSESLDVALEHAAPDVLGAHGVPGRPFAVLAHVEQARAGLLARERLLDRDRAHPVAHRVDEAQEARE
jgi:hypothetical protein